MSSQPRRRANFAIALAGSAALAFAQSTASLSGRVVAEDGHAVRATVTLSFAAARGYPSPPRRILTGSDGAFNFAKLVAGRYVLCAQVAAAEPASTNAPYIDTCLWGSSQGPITIAAGQQASGVVYTAPKGAVLTIPVSDPDHVLPAISSKAPAPFEPQFQLMVKGADGLYRHAHVASTTSAGRNYQIAIPLNAAIALRVSSTVANIVDQAGNAVQEGSENPLPAITASAGVSQPGSPQQPAFTLHHK